MCAARTGPHGIGKIFGQEKEHHHLSNLARMNVLLHGIGATLSSRFTMASLTNDWDMLREAELRRRSPTSTLWSLTHRSATAGTRTTRWARTCASRTMGWPRSRRRTSRSCCAWSHHLKDNGVMAIILPHGVLFRGGAEAKIRRKLLDDGHIDTVIGLPANLFYSTGIPVCILVLKKCKKPDDVLFINASEHFEKGNRQNYLSDEHIGKIVDTYQQRPESIERYARRVDFARD